MAQYTITTSAAEDAQLTFALNFWVNPRRVAAGQPAINLTQLVNGLFNQALDDAKAQVQGFVNKDRADKFTAASQSLKDQVDALLGTSIP